MICSFQRSVGSPGSKKTYLKVTLKKIKIEIDSLDLYLRGKL